MTMVTPMMTMARRMMHAERAMMRDRQRRRKFVAHEDIGGGHCRRRDQQG